MSQADYSNVMTICQRVETEGIESLSTHEQWEILDAAVSSGLLSQDVPTQVGNGSALLTHYCQKIVRMVDEYLKKDYLSTLPCDVLLQILDQTSTADYGRFASVSKYLYNCVRTGRFDPDMSEQVMDRLAEKKRQHLMLVEQMRFARGKRFANDYPHVWRLQERFGDELLEEPILFALSHHPFDIDSIKNPTQKMQLASVGNLGFVLKNLPQADKEVQLAAVRNNGFAVQYIKNPDKDVQMAAVEEKGQSIRHIRNPDQDVQVAAVKQNPWVIKSLPNAATEVRIAAVEKNPHVIYHIDNPEEEVQLAAVIQNPSLLKCIKNPFVSVQEVARRGIGERQTSGKRMKY